MIRNTYCTNDISCTKIFPKKFCAKSLIVTKVNTNGSLHVMKKSYLSLRTVKYNILICGRFSDTFSPLKDRTQGCFCKYLDYVLIREKRDQRFARILPYFYRVYLVTFKHLIETLGGTGGTRILGWLQILRYITTLMALLKPHLFINLWPTL